MLGQSGTKLPSLREQTPSLAFVSNTEKGMEHNPYKVLRVHSGVTMGGLRLSMSVHSICLSYLLSWSFMIETKFKQ